MIVEKKTTAPVSSVGADGVQPNVKLITEIIANSQQQINLQTADKLSDRHASEKAQFQSPEQSGLDVKL